MVERFEPHSGASRASRLDYLWSEHVGLYGVSEEDELEAIRELKGKLVWSHIHELYLMSQRWGRLREKVLKRDGRRCVKCKSEYVLHVDHKEYPSVVGAEKLDDLQTLCFYCHKDKTHGFDLGANKTIGREPVEVEGELFKVMRNAT